MSYLLFAGYFFLLAWLLTKIKFVQRSGLSPVSVCFLFAAKVIAGMVLGWIFRNDINSDTWQYHRLALDEYHLLFNHPADYLSNLFQSGYEHKYDGLLKLENSYWNDLRTNLVIKLVSLLHLFSFGNYYVNVVLFNFIVFFGHVALYRTFINAFNTWKIPIMVGCFLLPSLLLFSSMIHKDGVIFFAVSLAFYALYALKNGNRSISVLLLLIMGMLLIFLIRSYIFIALLPAVLAWYLSANRSNQTTIKTFALVYGGSIILFFASFYFTSVSLPNLIIQKQTDFLSLEKARSYIGVPALELNPLSFVKALPAVLNHVLARPFFTDYKLSSFLFLFAIEWYAYIILAIVFFFRRAKGDFNLSFTLYCLAFGFVMMALIGYTVPILWAIVRYRSIYLPFLLVPLISRINWKRFKRLDT